MAGNASNIIVYDLETGGLRPGEHGVCEIAMIAIDINTLQETERYEAIIQPYKDKNGHQMLYEDGAFKVNGLSMKKIENGKPADQVAKEIVEFAKRAKSKSLKPMLAGHNIDKFDIPHLDHFLSVHKIDAAKHFSDDTIDTLKWAKYKWIPHETMSKFNLAACCKQLGIRLLDAHSAMPDTEANAKLVVKFLQSLRGDGESMSMESDESFRETFNF